MNKLENLHAGINARLIFHVKKSIKKESLISTKMLWKLKKGIIQKMKDN
jgi:hypothetical protein